MIGTFTSNVDMKSGAPAFGTPEYMRATQMTGQMARFYGLPMNDGTVTLVRDAVEVPASIGAGATAVVPFLAGTTVGWRFEG